MSGQEDPKANDDYRDSKGKFLPGNKAGGRPKGSRNKLGEKFLEDLHGHWEKNGKVALDMCLEDNPSAYVKVVASILPKELNVKVDPYEEMSDDELDRRLRELAAEVLGVRTASRPEKEEGGAEQAKDLPPLH